MSHDAIKLFSCDFNFSMDGDTPCPSAPQDWAFTDPSEYFEWHRDFGNNVVFCHAYAFGGYAFYPTRLGPLAPGPGSNLLPSLFDLANESGMPFWSYFCVGTDHAIRALRPHWTVPGTEFLAPESPWTSLLCDRVREFLAMYPVDWILFDWFVYGGLNRNGTAVMPSSYVRKPFREIIGHPMPVRAEDISNHDGMEYKRQILTRQFVQIRDAVRETSPRTKIIFNVPYREAAGALWADHAMLKESDGLFSECTDDDVMEWLLTIRRPKQRVMTTIRGQAGEGKKGDPRKWRKWYERGCDFMGYAFGTPPDFRPHPMYREEVDLVRLSFSEMT